MRGSHAKNEYVVQSRLEWPGQVTGHAVTLKQAATLHFDAGISSRTFPQTLGSCVTVLLGYVS